MAYDMDRILGVVDGSIKGEIWMPFILHWTYLIVDGTDSRIYAASALRGGIYAVGCGLTSSGCGSGSR